MFASAHSPYLELEHEQPLKATLVVLHSPQLQLAVEVCACNGTVLEGMMEQVGQAGYGLTCTA